MIYRRHGQAAATRPGTTIYDRRRSLRHDDDIDAMPAHYEHGTDLLAGHVECTWPSFQAGRHNRRGAYEPALDIRCVPALAVDHK